MARKKVEDINTTLQSWEDVNRALFSIAENQRIINEIALESQRFIDEEKREAEKRISPYKAEVNALARNIQGFAQINKVDLGKRKTVAMSFGSIGFRKSAKIVLPKGPDKVKAIIVRLREMGMADCIRMPSPQVDKDALRKYDEDVIREAGARVDVSDTFWYEVNQELLESGKD